MNTKIKTAAFLLVAGAIFTLAGFTSKDIDVNDTSATDIVEETTNEAVERYTEVIRQELEMALEDNPTAKLYSGISTINVYEKKGDEEPVLVDSYDISEDTGERIDESSSGSDSSASSASSSGCWIVGWSFDENGIIIEDSEERIWLDTSDVPSSGYMEGYCPDNLKEE